MKSPFSRNMILFAIIVIAIIGILVVYAFDVGGMKHELGMFFTNIQTSVGGFFNDMNQRILSIPFFQQYGGWITAGVGCAIGVLVMSLYYKGKIGLRRYFIQDAAQETGLMGAPQYNPQVIPQQPASTAGASTIPQSTTDLPTLPPKEDGT